MKLITKINNFYSNFINMHKMLDTNKFMLFLGLFLSIISVIIETIITVAAIIVGIKLFPNLDNSLPLIKFFEKIIFFNIELFSTSEIKTVFLLFCLLIFRSLCNFLVNSTLTIAKNRISTHIRMQLITNLLLIDYDYNYKFSPGYSEQIISSESKAVGGAYISLILSLTGFFYLLTLILILFLIDYKILYFLSITFILLGFFKFYYSKFILILSNSAKSYEFNLMKKLNTILLKIKEIKINDSIYRHLIGIKNKAKGAELKNNYAQNLHHLEPTLNQIFLIIVIFIFYFIFVNAEILSQSAILMSIFVTYRIVPHLIKASQKFSNFLRLTPGVNKTYKLYSLKYEIGNENLISDQGKKTIIKTVEVNKVDYKINDRKILNSVSFSLKQGDFALLVGKSGSGKTSLLNLLILFLKPTSGNIFYNGSDVNNLNLKDLLASISFVTQDGILLRGSIYNIIKDQNTKINNQEIDKILNLTGCDEFISLLPKGIHTNIDEGIKLSGGQIQRIAIARALASQKNFLIFDEATSELDSNSEKKIYKNIKQYNKNFIILITSHKKNNFDIVDKILHLDENV
tara:strand:+ start:17625 stop:19343 length:1719 start_codon:yes stop_codon:yes gene_type:complete